MAPSPSTPITLRELIDEEMATPPSPRQTISTEAPSSTRSGHAPGTPKPPFDPPRRRSSLHFSRAFSCSPAPDTRDDVSIDLPASPREIEADRGKQTPSNIGRRRAPMPVTTSVTPGHVAQMQRLFQSAKASLRLDMAFAASPTGSIGSPADDPAAVTEDTTDAKKAWRYSTAPGILLGYDRDVREPVPGASPPLPTPSSETNVVPGREPISSGFNTPEAPADIANESADEPRSSPPDTALKGHDMIELQEQLEELGMGGDVIQSPMAIDESPLVARLKRLSADAQQIMDVSEDLVVDEPSDSEIFLSEPAKAAAASAKEKRGILRSLFHLHRSSHEVLSPAVVPQQEDGKGKQYR
ncbi:uncharacterized protein AB675_6421 [Cyphellophora attinorum]|uniref:Uncharacterized protein n=1 Tax=Cyphellophora attinorum TaxID=1664694 RepID=A0A0N0NQP5_9EURO|nr:uncharacterized protein AB675_6421 [Phialophora attinorum]KPI44151.1 hypothetical protein AB675_6421 [Phialophora attinorum]